MARNIRIFLIFGVVVYSLLSIFITDAFAGYDLGRTISVRIFSKEKLKHVQIQSVNSPLLISENSRTNYVFHEAEGRIVSVDFANGQLRIVSPTAEFFATRIFVSCNDHTDGLLSIGSVQESPRKYRGIFRIEVRKDALLVINELAMEQYLYGVIPSEMSSKWELEALKAQAIVSRTYAYKNLDRHEEDGYDFCDLTHCQSYKGYDGEKPRTNWAVDGTRSLVIAYNGDLIDAYYHSTCGGKTSRGDEVWSMMYKPYLVSVDDTINGKFACSISPHFDWVFRVAKLELSEALKISVDSDPGNFLERCYVESTHENDRVQYIRIAGENHRKIAGWQFRRILCKKFGWNSIKSSNFRIEDMGNSYLFIGRGLGHGVGMCQYGALTRAKEGFLAEEILLFYFPGTKIQSMKN